MRCWRATRLTATCLKADVPALVRAWGHAFIAAGAGPVLPTRLLAQAPRNTGKDSDSVLDAARRAFDVAHVLEPALPFAAFMCRALKAAQARSDDASAAPQTAFVGVKAALKELVACMVPA